MNLQSLSNMMLGSMMPMNNMFPNMMGGVNNGINNLGQTAQYYYSKGGKQMGPFSEAQLTNHISTGEINAFTYLWKTGMGDWTLATNFQEFQNILK
jgi:hypothetical protein